MATLRNGQSLAPRMAAPSEHLLASPARSALRSPGSEAKSIASSPAMQGWLATWDAHNPSSGMGRHWFALKQARLESEHFEGGFIQLQPSSRAVGFVEAVSSGSLCNAVLDSMAQVRSHPWAFVLDVRKSAGERSWIFFDAGNGDALEAWVGALGREVGRLSGNGAWTDIEACKAALDARARAEAVAANEETPRLRTFEQSASLLQKRGPLSSSTPCIPGPPTLQESRRSPGLSPLRGASGGGGSGPLPSSTAQDLLLGSGDSRKMNAEAVQIALASPAVCSDITTPSPGREPHGAYASEDHLAELSRLAAANSELQTELEEVRAVGRAAQAAQQRVATQAMAQMMAQSQEAADHAAETRRLRNELAEAQRRNACSEKENDPQSTLLVRLRELETQLNEEKIIAQEHKELAERTKSENAKLVATCDDALAKHLEQSKDRKGGRASLALEERALTAPNNDVPLQVALLQQALELEREPPSQTHKSIRMNFSLTNISYEKLSDKQKGKIREAVAGKLALAAGVSRDAIRVFLSGGSVKVMAEVVTTIEHRVEEIKDLMAGPIGHQVAQDVLAEVKVLPDIQTAAEGTIDAISTTAHEAVVAPKTASQVGAWGVIFKLHITLFGNASKKQELWELRDRVAQALSLDSRGVRVEIADADVFTNNDTNPDCALRGLPNEESARQLCMSLRETWDQIDHGTRCKCSITEVRVIREPDFTHDAQLNLEEIDVLWDAFVAADVRSEGWLAYSQFMDMFDNVCGMTNRAKPSNRDLRGALDKLGKPRKLQVLVIGATNLKSLSWIASDKLWCQCKVKHGDKRETLAFKTNVLTGDLDPQWNETHVIDAWHVGDELEFTIYDSGSLTNRVEGRVLVPSSSFYPEVFSGSLPISGLQGSCLQLRVEEYSTPVLNFLEVTECYARFKKSELIKKPDKSIVAGLKIETEPSTKSTPPETSTKSTPPPAKHEGAKLAIPGQPPQASTDPNKLFELKSEIVVLIELIVREAESMDSLEIAHFSAGQRCIVLAYGELNTRRMRVADIEGNKEGWISCTSAKGEALVKSATEPEKKRRPSFNDVLTGALGALPLTSSHKSKEPQKETAAASAPTPTIPNVKSDKKSMFAFGQKSDAPPSPRPAYKDQSKDQTKEQPAQTNGALLKSKDTKSSEEPHKEAPPTTPVSPSPPKTSEKKKSIFAFAMGGHSHSTQQEQETKSPEDPHHRDASPVSPSPAKDKSPASKKSIFAFPSSSHRSASPAPPVKDQAKEQPVQTHGALEKPKEEVEMPTTPRRSFFNFGHKAEPSKEQEKPAAKKPNASKKSIFSPFTSNKDTSKSPRTPATPATPANQAYGVGQWVQLTSRSIVRKQEALQSEKIMELESGELCVVQQLGVDDTGRRLCVKVRDKNVTGWISCSTATGSALLKAVAAPAQDPAAFFLTTAEEQAGWHTSNHAAVGMKALNGGVEVTVVAWHEDYPYNFKICSGAGHVETVTQEKLDTLLGRRVEAVATPQAASAKNPSTASRDLSPFARKFELQPEEIDDGWSVTGSPLIGKRVFHGGNYGSIVAWFSEEPLYRVVYDDGEDEDLDQDEASAALASFSEAVGDPEPITVAPVPPQVSRAPSSVKRFELSKGDIADGWTQTGSALLEKRIRRVFNGSPIDGTIVAWNPQDAHYRAMHDDGDVEDLDENEVREAVKAFGQNSEKSKTVARIPSTQSAAPPLTMTTEPPPTRSAPPSQPPGDDAPSKAYSVGIEIQCVQKLIVRCYEDAQSGLVGEVNPGQHLKVLAHGVESGRRLKVSAVGKNLQGWISCCTANGEALVKIAPPVSQAKQKKSIFGFASHSPSPPQTSDHSSSPKNQEEKPREKKKSIFNFAGKPKEDAKKPQSAPEQQSQVGKKSLFVGVANAFKPPPSPGPPSPRQPTNPAPPSPVPPVQEKSVVQPAPKAKVEASPSPSVREIDTPPPTFTRPGPTTQIPKPLEKKPSREEVTPKVSQAKAKTTAEETVPSETSSTAGQSATGSTPTPVSLQPRRSKYLTDEDVAEGWKESGHRQLGQRVRRIFPDAATDASVVAWHPDDPLFRIRHDDSDIEDLNEDELEQALEDYKKSQTSRKEPEMAKVEAEDKDSDDSDSDDDMDDEEFENMLAKRIQASNCRKSVAAERWTKKGDWKPPVHEKTPEQRKQIKAAISKSFMFNALEGSMLEQVIDAFEGPQMLMKSEEVIGQGDSVTSGTPALFVLQSGVLDVYKRAADEHGQGTKVHSYTESGSTFGELALLYNCPRAATVVAREKSEIWSIDRETFNHCVKGAAVKQRELRDQFLASVELLKALTVQERSQLADVLLAKTYNEGEKIISQGDVGNEMYFVENGSAAALMGGLRVKSYSTSDYFGELALLQSQPRAADVVATSTPTKVLSLDGNSFRRLLGNLAELMAARAEEYNTHRVE